MIHDLNDETLLLYAIKSYNKINYVQSEFYDDFKAFRYVKRLLQKYRVTKEIRINLILNHLILLYNVFGVEAGTRILFCKSDVKDYSALKTFCLFLNAMPDKILAINGKDIISSDIPLDMSLVEQLRKI